MAAIEAIKKLGIRVIITNKECKIFGKGIDLYGSTKKYNNKCSKFRDFRKTHSWFINKYPEPINLVGDKSLSRRDFKRISNPLSKFERQFKLRDNNFTIKDLWII